MSAPSPGPWRWLGNHSLVSDNGKRPAVLTGRELRQYDATTGLLRAFEPESPDGRLMAAAPDLLAAAEEAAQILERHHAETGNHVRGANIATLRAAIAKAVGR